MHIFGRPCFQTVDAQPDDYPSSSPGRGAKLHVYNVNQVVIHTAGRPGRRPGASGTAPEKAAGEAGVKRVVLGGRWTDIGR